MQYLTLLPTIILSLLLSLASAAPAPALNSSSLLPRTNHTTHSLTPPTNLTIRSNSTTRHVAPLVNRTTDAISPAHPARLNHTSSLRPYSLASATVESATDDGLPMCPAPLANGKYPITWPIWKANPKCRLRVLMFWNKGCHADCDHSNGN